MTSRALFCKGMIEDLRHRIWMIALSSLGSFLALPVLFLLLSQEWDNRISRWTVSDRWNIDEYKIECVQNFFKSYMTVSSGIILVAGALIVGIFGFRHVFSKRMVDLYHSIPITRKEQFLIHYVNGFLIWFVPMLLGALSTSVFAAFFLKDLAMWTGAMGAMLVTIGNLVVSFLIVYHVTIVAVMLSGNILNTLLSGAILSFAALAFYGMFEAFAETYFETYYSFWTDNLKNIIWASPIPASIYQMYMGYVGQIYWLPFIMNIVMIILMFVAGFILYIRRPSELAEQGLKIKVVQIVFKTIMALLAGMVGWILFHFITGDGSIGWMVFGAVFASVLVYGIFDIIFNMDFKAFFAHKLQMGITVLASVFIGFVFLFDLVGYDSYLPKKDNIKNMGIYVNGFDGGSSDMHYNREFSTENRINSMEYTDQDAIYDFLARMTGKDGQVREGSSTTAWVRIEEKSGRTYYRIYRVAESDEEIIVPILRDKEYVETNMLIPQSVIDHVYVDLENGRSRIENFYQSRDMKDVEAVKAFLNAYNQDILANPDLFIYQNAEILGRGRFRANSDYYYYINLDIYDSMENVLSFLKANGQEDILKKPGADEIKSIEITAYLSENYSNNLRVFFGLDEAKEEEKNEQVIVLSENSAEMVSVDAMQIVAVEDTKAYPYGEYVYRAVLDKPEDINELMQVICMENSYGHTIFRPDYVGCDINITFHNGDTYYVQMKKGVLPERFIEYFTLVK